MKVIAGFFLRNPVVYIQVEMIFGILEMNFGTVENGLWDFGNVF